MTLDDGWRGPILQHFSEASARAGRLTVVSDPDELLTEPGLVERLAARGFEVLTFEDPVAFRYAYETRFRRHWDEGRSTHLVVVLRTRAQDLRSVPHDLLEDAREGGRVLTFSLPELFPTLSPTVVADLDHQHFDALFAAVLEASSEMLGANATTDFVLRHVFEIAPELIRSPADLLRMLIRRHYRGQSFPARFDQRLLELLHRRPEWSEWPLESVLSSRDAFLTFLQERWPRFLVRQGLQLLSGREPCAMSMRGPEELPFDHDDIRVYMDNLFVEGHLAPTDSVEPPKRAAWYSVGIAGAPGSSPEARFDALGRDLSTSIPSAKTATFRDWQTFALRFGTWTRLRWQTRETRDAARERNADAFVEAVQREFSEWLLRSFGSMSTLPYLPAPVLGHHVPHYLAHRLGDGRIALLVIDGMAIDQWRILHEAISDRFEIEESAIFSWVPTLTQIGRQAIFSGRMPFEFANTITGTSAEPWRWSGFWQDHGLPGRSVRYVNPQGKKESFEPLHDDILHHAADRETRVIGAVIGLIDQNMHQIALGIPGLHGLVDVWAKTHELANLTEGLHAEGFDVYVTADHGNTFGRGMGKPDIGATAQQRGERAHIFRNVEFRNQVARTYPDAVEWPSVGLPPDYFPLLAPYGACFLPEGKEAVSHGGIALEEVMVPFVRLAPRTK
jgi:hypothetical protein